MVDPVLPAPPPTASLVRWGWTCMLWFIRRLVGPQHLPYSMASTLVSRIVLWLLSATFGAMSRGQCIMQPDAPQFGSDSDSQSDLLGLTLDPCQTTHLCRP